MGCYWPPSALVRYTMTQLNPYKHGRTLLPPSLSETLIAEGGGGQVTPMTLNFELELKVLFVFICSCFLLCLLCCCAAVLK